MKSRSMDSMNYALYTLRVEADAVRPHLRGYIGLLRESEGQGPGLPCGDPSKWRQNVMVYLRRLNDLRRAIAMLEKRS